MSEEVPYGYCHCGCGQKTTISKHTSNKHGRVRGEPTKYLGGHGKQPAVVDYVVDTATGCWVWQRYTDKYGRPRFSRAINGKGSADLIYYERFAGPIPDDHTLIRTCETPICVNPTHALLLSREELFWRRVDKNGPIPPHRPELGPCWLWTGTRNTREYGFWWNGESQRMAHRAAYEFSVNALPTDICLLHQCDNPPCVNPSHMCLGTKGDNQSDMVAKGRSLTGERNYKAKLTVNDVIEIRRLHQAGEHSQQSLATMFSVHQGTISDIIRGRNWRHIPQISE